MASLGRVRLNPVNTPPTHRVTIRRAPRPRAFVLVGIAIGVVGVLFGSSFFPPDPALGPGLVTGYFMVWGVAVGVTGGLISWLIADRRSKKTATEVTMEQTGPEDTES